MSRDGRTGRVLVTGGSRGIGRAICLAFGTAGWHVGVHYRTRKHEAEETASLVEVNGGVASLCPGDVRNRSQVDVMLSGFVKDAGGIDTIVCNAGTNASRLLLRFSLDEWAAVLATNLTGTFHCLQAAARYMVAQRDGSIVLVASSAALQGQTGQSAYAASKAGVLGLMRTAARELGADNVRVNAVFPGWHATELTEGVVLDEKRSEHALGRLSDLEEVGRLIYQLATARHVSGQIWNLDSRVL